jgi:hypothetical protein
MTLRTVSLPQSRARGTLALRCVRTDACSLRFIPIGCERDGDLRELFAGAVTIRVDHFRRGSWLDDLARQVAFDHCGCAVRHVSLFLSPRGGSTPPHYDANDVLVLQLRGLKKLRVSHAPYDPEPAEDTLVDSLRPHPILQFELRRGDAVIIPRGYAHETWSTMASITVGIGLQS